MNLGFTQVINGKPNHFINKIWLGISINKLTTISEYQNSRMAHYDKFGKDWANSNSDKPKIHTIRIDEKNNWKSGKNIHFIINNRTKNRFQFAPVLKCKSVQEIIISHTDSLKYVHINGNCLTESEVEILAINDGFDSLVDFFQYFNKDFKGKIIHWTDVKYK